MAWKRRSKNVTIDVDVDLDDIDADALFQSLIDRGYLTEDEAQRALGRTGDRGAVAWGDLEEAKADIRVGRIREGLIHIERFLGTEFFGRLVR